MKRIVIVLMLGLGLASPVLAAQRGTAEYQKLKEFKAQQREEKKTRKADPSPKAKGFWQREAERSGLAGTGAMFTHAISNTLPLDKPNSRKEA